MMANITDIHNLQAKVDRLNRIMPHIGGTCKWNDSDEDKCIHTESDDRYGTVGAVAGCCSIDDCTVGKWELKE